MLNPFFDSDYYYGTPFSRPTYRGMRLSPYQNARLQRNERMKRAELANQRRLEEKAHLQRLADLEHQRRLVREREEMRERRRRYRRAAYSQERENIAMEDMMASDSESSTSSIDDNPKALTRASQTRFHPNHSGMSEDFTEQEMENEQMGAKERYRQTRRIVVEDASDSECEDEVLHSPWRNRRPSPGEWMEPIALKEEQCNRQ